MHTYQSRAPRINLLHPRFDPSRPKPVRAEKKEKKKRTPASESKGVGVPLLIFGVCFLGIASILGGLVWGWYILQGLVPADIDLSWLKYLGFVVLAILVVWGVYRLIRRIWPQAAGTAAASTWKWTGDHPVLGWMMLGTAIVILFILLFGIDPKYYGILGVIGACVLGIIGAKWGWPSVFPGHGGKQVIVKWLYRILAVTVVVGVVKFWFIPTLRENPSPIGNVVLWVYDGIFANKPATSSAPETPAPAAEASTVSRNVRSAVPERRSCWDVGERGKALVVGEKTCLMGEGDTKGSPNWELPEYGEWIFIATRGNGDVDLFCQVPRGSTQEWCTYEGKEVRVIQKTVCIKAYLLDVIAQKGSSTNMFFTSSEQTPKEECDAMQKAAG